MLSDSDKRAYYDETGEAPDPRRGASPAETLVAELLQQFAFEDGKDLFEMIRDHCRQAITKVDQGVSSGRRQIEKLEKRLAKIKQQNKGSKNKAGLKFVTQLIEAGIVGSQAQLASLEQSKTRYENALDLVEHLKCSGEGRRNEHDFHEAVLEAMWRPRRP